MKIKSIRNIEIKTKLLLLGIISIAGLILMGVESILTARQINQASSDINQSWLPSVIIAEELHTGISAYRIKEYFHIIATEPDIMKQTEEEMRKLREEIHTDFNRYESYITNEEDRELIEQAKVMCDGYMASSERLLELSRNNQKEQVLELMRGESKRLFDDSSLLFLKIMEFNKEGAYEASVNSDALYRRLTRVKIFTISLIAAIIAILVIYIIIAVEKPVKAILEGTRRASNGDLGVYLEYKSEDEIGVLTGSVNALIARLNDIIKDERHLLHEIGRENYDVQSSCQQAYRGDFAPILYSITSLQSQLKQSHSNQKKKNTGKPEKRATIERISLKGKRKNNYDSKVDAICEESRV